jgi:hypothetical protein
MYTSMSRVEFEPAISEIEDQKTVQALEPVTTGIGRRESLGLNLAKSPGISLEEITINVEAAGSWLDHNSHRVPPN